MVTPVTSYEEMLFAPVSDEEAYVAFISEPGVDTHHFRKRPWKNLVGSLADVRGLTGVIVDGLVSRIDRPEYLNDELTYWNPEPDEDVDRIPYDGSSVDHSFKILERQLKMIDARLRELRRALPHATIVYNLRDDHFQHTNSLLLNQMMLARINAMRNDIRELVQERRELEQRRTDDERLVANLRNETGRAASSQRYNARRRLETAERNIGSLTARIDTMELQRQALRPNKESPFHQQTTHDLITGLFKQLQEICEKHGVILLKEEGIVRFGRLTATYAHSGHKTWGCTKTRPNKMRTEVARMMTRLKKPDQMMTEQQRRHPDAENLRRVLKRDCHIVEGGHSGRPFATFERGPMNPKEVNMRHMMDFDPEVNEQNVLVMAVPAFEDREAIEAFVRGREPVRMSGGKPGGTRNSHAIDRWYFNAPPGIALVHVDKDGFVTPHIVGYQAFKEGIGVQAMKHIVGASSDDHIGGSYELHSCLLGFTRMVERDANNDFAFLGQEGARLVGIQLPGDQADAGTSRWSPGRDKFDMHPRDVFKIAARWYASKDTSDPEDLRMMAILAASVASGGTTENTDCILDWTTDYMWTVLHSVYPNTLLQHALVHVEGNHIKDSEASRGRSGNAFLAQRMKAAGIPYDQVARPDFIFQEEHEAARVLLGGSGIGLTAMSAEYGKTVDGDYLFGPYKLLMNHNPKGGDLERLISTGIQMGADLVASGHVHACELVPYLNGEDIGFGYTVPTTTGMTDVEVRLANAVRRVQGALYLGFGPYQIAMRFHPIALLRAEGQAAQREIVREALEAAAK